MEGLLLLSKFKNETTKSRIQEQVEGISGNHLSHRAEAFKLGLRTVLDLKQQTDTVTVTTESVTLRCRSRRCSGHKEHMLYSFPAYAHGARSITCSVLAADT